MELEPDREAQRQLNRQRIMQYIARELLPPVLETPQPDIGLDDDTIS